MKASLIHKQREPLINPKAVKKDLRQQRLVSWRLVSWKITSKLFEAIRNVSKRFEKIRKDSRNDFEVIFQLTSLQLTSLCCLRTNTCTSTVNAMRTFSQMAFVLHVACNSPSEVPTSRTTMLFF